MRDLTLEEAHELHKVELAYRDALRAHIRDPGEETLRELNQAAWLLHEAHERLGPLAT